VQQRLLAQGRLTRLDEPSHGALWSDLRQGMRPRETGLTAQFDLVNFLTSKLGHGVSSQYF
jgi:hypothetical protein